MESMIEDKRELRRSEQVMYLPMQDDVSLSSNELPEFIYESQLSVMVTGIDDWVWAAYCFVDIYFKAHGTAEECIEQVEYYANPRVYANARVERDTHSCGKYPASLPIWDPREYFLRSLSARMEQVREEWTNSVNLLIYQIEPYVCASSAAEGIKIDIRVDSFIPAKAHRKKDW
jgi:hypothetical protein